MKSRAEKEVQSWIEGNFEQEGVQQEDWPMLPGGVIIRDRKGGEALVWWDFLTEKVQIKIKERR